MNFFFLTVTDVYQYKSKNKSAIKFYFYVVVYCCACSAFLNTDRLKHFSEKKSIDL